MVLGFLGLGYLSRVDIHSSYPGGVLPALILMGIAMGMVMAPSMSTATAGGRPQDSGVAAALVSTMQQVGGSIGTALLSTIAATATTSHATSHATTSGFDAAAATHGYSVAFLTSALVFAAGGVLAAALFPPKQRLSAKRASVASTAAGPTENAASELLAADA